MAQMGSLFLGLPPPAVFLLEVLAGSVAIGFTPSGSLSRLAAIPVLSSCVYGVVTTAGYYMPPRWASLLGGTSFAFLLQYIDISVVSGWNFKDQGPPTKREKLSSKDSDGLPAHKFWNPLSFGWSSMWAFRRVNTSYEVKHVPPYSSSDPSYVPPKWTFIGQRLLVTAACYLVLDLLALRKPAVNNTGIFGPAQAFMTTGFAITFYCIVQGSQSLAATVAVASGLSKVESWRPAFGSLTEAYSLKIVWGKFWHQLLRRPLSGPASAIIHDVLGLPRGTVSAGFATLFLSFTISAMLHAAAGFSSGAPSVELGVFRFIWTQAFGIVIEDGLGALLHRIRGGKRGKKTCYFLRGVGFVWVAAYLTWSAPVWLYPQVLRPARAGPSGFLPFSVLKWVLDRK